MSPWPCQDVEFFQKTTSANLSPFPTSNHGSDFVFPVLEMYADRMFSI